MYSCKSWHYIRKIIRSCDSLERPHCRTRSQGHLWKVLIQMLICWWRWAQSPCVTVPILFQSPGRRCLVGLFGEFARAGGDYLFCFCRWGGCHLKKWCTKKDSPRERLTLKWGTYPGRDKKGQMFMSRFVFLSWDTCNWHMNLKLFSSDEDDGCAICKCHYWSYFRHVLVLTKIYPWKQNMHQLPLLWNVDIFLFSFGIFFFLLNSFFYSSH